MQKIDLRANFISDSASTPIDFAWKGSTRHTGPAEPSGPLLDVVAGMTTCGTLALEAGMLLWGAARLRTHADIQDALELAAAAFAYQVDFRYVDTGPTQEVPEMPPASSALAQMSRYMRTSLDPSRYWHDYYQPAREAFHMAHLVRHILPKAAQNDFAQWLKMASARLHSVSPKPDDFREYDEFDSDEEYNAWVAPHRGSPLPPEVLDPAYDYHAKDREGLVLRFIASLDPTKNRYLRTPEAMRAQGYEGDPYSGV
jgi:hypothetical protein